MTPNRMTLPYTSKSFRSWLPVTLCGALLGISASSVASPPSGAGAGQVTLDLERWTAMQKEIELLSRSDPPPHGYAIRNRSLEIRFDRGLVRGRLEAQIETFTDTSIQVPVIGADTSLEAVVVDKERAVAVHEGETYSVLLDGARLHTVGLQFAVGREESRFSRSFSLGLPSAPATRVILELFERDLEVDIRDGVVTDQYHTERGTRLEAVLKDAPALSVSWKQKVVHDAVRHREMEASSHTLLSVGEEVVRIQTELEWKLLSGETDRVEASVPTALEVGNVTGESVLQWYSDLAKDGTKRLVVLLRHLVDDKVRIVVQGQIPQANQGQGPTTIVFLEPHAASLRSGILVIEGHPSFNVTPNVKGAGSIGMREVPPTLMALSNRPLLHAFRFEKAWPDVSLLVQRNADIALTQAIIDELQASTVQTEAGIEITKLRLHVRNNTRQYLTLILPEAAVVTHALIDGSPFHPAVSMGEGAQEKLLIPLRQSEKLGPHTRVHIVQSGETLSELSVRYFHRTDGWSDILTENSLSNEYSLHEGQKIRIPTKSGDIHFEESSFVIEIAYKVQRDGLSFLGARRVELPALDIPVMSATWHYYFPKNFMPVSFSTNLRQLDFVRYDPLQRLEYFLQHVFYVRNAWAGGGAWTEYRQGSYENILESRKAIYRKENKSEITEALAAFPLVGQRFRFHRVLLGERPAFIELFYLENALLPGLRWGALLVAAGLTWLFASRYLRAGRRAVLEPRLLLSSLGASGLLFGLAHFILGIHRQMLLGATLGLWLSMLFGAGPKLMERMRARMSREPLLISNLWQARTIRRLFVLVSTLGLMVAFPMLLSTFLFLFTALIFFWGIDRKVTHV